MATISTEDADEQRYEEHSYEHSSLLHRAASLQESDGAQQNDEITIETSSLTPRNVLLCTALIVTAALVEVISLFQMLATNQILEDIICGRLGSHNRGNDAVRCGENEAVQAELALLRGWQVTFDYIPGVLTSIPYGLMADRYGSKLVFCLSILGTGLSSVYYIAFCRWPDGFSIRLIWLSSLFQMIGGGSAVLASVVFSMLSELVPDVHRSTAFFSFGAVVFAFELVGSPLAAALMDFNPWFPIYVGFGLYAPVLLLIILLPRDLGVPSRTSTSPDSPPGAEPISLSQSASFTNSQHEERAGTIRRALDGSFSPSFSEKLTKSWAGLVHFARNNAPVALLLSTRLTTTLGRSAEDMLLQYARRRFGWSWSQTGYLVSFKATLILLLLAVILPFTNYSLSKLLSLRSFIRDFHVARASCLLLLAGNLVIGLATTDALLFLGYNDLLRALLVQLVEPSHRSTILTTVAMIENLGAVIAGPLMSVVFRIGLSLSKSHQEDVWLGLPFMAAAGLLGITMAILCGIKGQGLERGALAPTTTGITVNENDCD